MTKLRHETIAVRIKTALEIKGMRQSELCRRAGIPKSSLSQYLSGDFEPKQDRIYLIAKALNVSEAWLMGFDVPMSNTEKINLQLFGKSPDEPLLTEGEKLWLELYRRTSEETRETIINMVESLEKLPNDQQQRAIDVIRVLLGGH